MGRVELPDGQWADMADPAKVVQRLCRPVRRTMFELVQLRSAKPVDQATIDPVEIDLLQRLGDLIVIALVASWSFPQPIDADGLGELPSDVYDALQLACAPLGGKLLPSVEVDKSEAELVKEPVGD